MLDGLGVTEDHLEVSVVLIVNGTQKSKSFAELLN